MAAASLKGVDIKLARALRHVNELSTEVDNALSSARQRVYVDDADAPAKVVYRVEGLPAVREEWSAIVGDVLTNLRAALDHLAWQLVLLDGGTPSGNTYFPLVDSPVDSQGRSRTELTPRLRSKELRSAVEEVQPFAFAKSPEEARAGLLWHIKELCNQDKHRDLLLVASMPDVNKIWWGGAEGDPSPRVLMNPKPREDGDWILSFEFPDSIPPSFDPHVGNELIIVLDEGAPLLRATPIQQSIKTMHLLVAESIVDWKFRPLFKSAVTEPQGRFGV